MHYFFPIDMKLKTDGKCFVACSMQNRCFVGRFTINSFHCPHFPKKNCKIIIQNWRHFHKWDLDDIFHPGTQNQALWYKWTHYEEAMGFCSLKSLPDYVEQKQKQVKRERQSLQHKINGSDSAVGEKQILHRARERNNCLRDPSLQKCLFCSAIGT